MPVNVEIKTRRGTAAEWASANPVLSDGEPGLETDTGVIKYGDDVSHWDELPAANKQFQNVVTVAKSGKRGTADFICSNYSSDDECIQAALNSAHSGSIINILEGIYTITTELTQYDKDISIIGIGNVIFNLNTSNKLGFYFAGHLVTSAELSENALKFGLQVNIADTSLVQPGDLIEIYNNLLWCPVEYDNMTTGELYEVKSVSGTTISLTSSLVRDYTTTDVSQVRVFRPIRVTIKNIQFIDSDPSGYNQSLIIYYSKNSVISNCIFKNAGYAAINFYYSYNIYIENNDIRDCIKDGSGYGIALWSANSFVSIEKNHIENCRHTISCNSAERKSLNRGIYIHNNTLIGAEAVGGSVIDSHSVSLDITISHNKIYPKITHECYNGKAETSLFEGNSVFGGTGSNSGGGVRGWGTLRDGSNYILKIINNYFEGCDYIYLSSGGTVGHMLLVENNILRGGSHGIRLNNGDGYTTAFKFISIVNNKIENVSYNGVYIKILTDGTNIKIKDNFISWFGTGGGIYLNGLTYTLGTILVDTNEIVDVGTGLLYGLGISLNNITNAKISNNNIIGTASLTLPGVYEYTGCDYNIFENNKFSLVHLPSIHMNGTHWIANNNDGYITENTGTATIPTSQTSIAVTHNLAATPTRVQLTPTTPTAGKQYHVSAKAATIFTITIDSAAEADISFDWSAVV